MVEDVCPSVLAHKWGAFAQPKSNEERVVALLEREFPGSDWIEEAPAVINGEAMTLEMVVIGTGPGPKNVLANDGVVYPYRKFKALRGIEIGGPRGHTDDGRTPQENRPPAASTLSEESTAASAAGSLSPSDTLPPGGPGAVTFIGGGNWNKRKLVNWVKKQPAGTKIVVGEGRITKDGKPLDAEAHLAQVAEDFGITVEFAVFPHHEDWYGKRASEIEVYDLCQYAGTIVTCGNGGRVDAAKKWLANPDFLSRRKDIPREDIPV